MVLLLLAWLFSQDPGAKAIETAHLTVTAASSQAAGKISLHADVVPKPGMHVYAPGQKGYIAVTLTLDPAAPVTTAGKAKFPSGEKVLMPALNETQLVYAQPFRITQDVAIRRGTAAGPITVKGTMRYQACDDKMCYKPATVPMEWRIPDR